MEEYIYQSIVLQNLSNISYIHSIAFQNDRDIYTHRHENLSLDTQLLYIDILQFRRHQHRYIV